MRGFGAKIGLDVRVSPDVSVTMPWNITIGAQSAVGDRAILYALGRIEIGERCTVSQGAHICAGTHDWRDRAMRLLKTTIVVGDDVWICADAFVGPSVDVGERAIVGARAVVTKDVEPGSILGGNPAKVISRRDQP